MRLHRHVPHLVPWDSDGWGAAPEPVPRVMLVRDFLATPAPQRVAVDDAVPRLFTVAGGAHLSLIETIPGEFAGGAARRAGVRLAEAGLDLAAHLAHLAHDVDIAGKPARRAPRGSFFTRWGKGWYNDSAAGAHFAI